MKLYQKYLCRLGNRAERIKSTITLILKLFRTLITFDFNLLYLITEEDRSKVRLLAQHESFDFTNINS